MGRLLTGIDAERVRVRAKALTTIDTLMRPVKFPTPVRTDALRPPPITSFKHVDPVMLLHDDDDWWMYDFEQYTPQVLWPIRVSWVVDREPINPEKYSGEPIHVFQVKTIKAADYRGMVHRISPHMVLLEAAHIYPDHAETVAMVVSRYGGNWVIADKSVDYDAKGIPNRMPHELMTYNVQASIALALRHRYEWAISFSQPETCSVRIATDPTGIKELFRLRDLPTAGGRRSMLSTWISDHWRSSRSDADMETYVRKQLRGTNKFSWHGFDCELLPAQYDLEKLEQLKAERLEMRKEGTDKRKRIPTTGEHRGPR